MLVLGFINEFFRKAWGIFRNWSSLELSLSLSLSRSMYRKEPWLGYLIVFLDLELAPSLALAHPPPFKLCMSLPRALELEHSSRSQCANPIPRKNGFCVSLSAPFKLCMSLPKAL